MSLFAKAKKAKENKKGFTLVELIVVLVILAILAAIMVPALLGWIDKAREKQIVINARSAYLAAQTLASEAYGADPNAADKTIKLTDVQALAGVSGKLTGTITMTNLTSGGTANVVLSYTEDLDASGAATTDAKYANYTNGQWVVDTKATVTTDGLSWAIVTSTP